MRSALLTICVIPFATLAACNSEKTRPPISHPASNVDIEAIRPKVVAFCGDCHAMPLPASFPKQAWPKEVQRGYDFYFDSGRNDLDLPSIEEVHAFYQQQAPDNLEFTQFPANIDAVTRGLRAVSPADTSAASLPAVSHVNWIQLDRDKRPVLVYCDMRSGQVSLVDPGAEKLATTRLCKLDNPAHAEPCDLNGDGRIDLVVADLGSPTPADHQLGRVVWLRRGQDGEFNPVVIKRELGRVADVRPADVDGDHDEDLIVAEFGWLKTGRILLLENVGLKNGTPEFKQRVLDDRHGTIHVPTADLDNDGDVDFVALISQEHEVVEAFVNDGKGQFERRPIHAAGDPSFGSSGIQLVDLDEDGDLDVLYANGDTLDAHLVKPYHGVQWLENRGEFPFTRHHLTSLPGVFRALAGDMDGDGDHDIVAVAMLPEPSLGERAESDFDSIIWLEQQRPNEFVRHRIERGRPIYAAFELADFNADGRPDLAAGAYTDATEPRPELTIWWNRPD